MQLKYIDYIDIKSRETQSFGDALTFLNNVIGEIVRLSLQQEGRLSDYDQVRRILTSQQFHSVTSKADISRFPTMYRNVLKQVQNFDPLYLSHVCVGPYLFEYITIKDADKNAVLIEGLGIGSNQPGDAAIHEALMRYDAAAKFCTN
ncbi:hypothetical protein OH460_08355 [Vibrio sp. Makdt]|uniref:hypothetical protein n=1 Tax=Vibrio sp. Makdt TaxID=2998828 RepID=UPI0022CD8339|nr:hypothetical protein [Vibrio sp. Makdt]MDA0152311.1 hypothetical protein [Vibrio sp. Makdt]